MTYEQFLKQKQVRQLDQTKASKKLAKVPQSHKGLEAVDSIPKDISYDELDMVNEASEESCGCSSQESDHSDYIDLE